MPEENKEPESVSPSPEGAKAPAEAAVPQKSEPQPAAPQAQAAEAKTPSAPATPATQSETKPAAPAAAAKPATPAAGTAPAAAKPPAPPAKPAGPTPLPWNSELVASLKQQYGSGIVEALSYLGQKYLTVDSSILPEILLRMRDAEEFDYCVDITAVHYPKREQQFDIVYVLYSFPKNERVRVKSRISDGEMVQSAVAIWPTAD